jgi:hypothetical protein
VVIIEEPMDAGGIRLDNASLWFRHQRTSSVVLRGTVDGSVAM